MSTLLPLLADYLAVRRAMGYQLASDEVVLKAFVGHLDERGEEFVTVEQAIAFAAAPHGANRAWLANRMSMVRGFAAFLHAADRRHEVVPAGLLPHGPHRATPYFYTDHEITALIRAAGRLPVPVTALTISTLIGLLAATGLRISEALALDTADVDLATGMLTVRRSKYGRSRHVPLHPSTVAAIAAYVDQRQRLLPAPVDPALFLTIVGTRKRVAHVQAVFRTLRTATGLAGRSARCRPRLHDLRHTFAVRTLIGWYRDGGDIAARLPLLSAYLGHREPKYTYWYLQAAPELLAEAALRLETPKEPA